MTELWWCRWESGLREKDRQILRDVLPPARQETLDKMRSEERQMQTLCAYGLLRRALWERYGLHDLPEITEGEHGKPCFRHCPQIHFNITHTQGAALVALSDAPVGVDLERVRSFSPRIRKLLDAEGETDAQALLRWTEREAKAKRSGLGIAQVMGRSSCGEEGECLALELPPPYVGAVCFSGPAPTGIGIRSIPQILRCE